MVIRMNKKSLLQLNAGLFALVAVLHLWRAVVGAEAVIAGIHVPLWASYVAVVVAGALAWKNWKA